MKSLTRVFAAFLLAVTIAFGGFSGNAHAQSSGAVNVAIDVNQTVDQVLKLIPSTQKFQIVIINKTGTTLTLAGAYNSYGNWALGDVPSLNAQYRDWTERGAGYFTYAVNYAVGNTGKYFQLGAAWPPVGRRKINLCTINSAGNGPAEQCWDNMLSADDKNVINGEFSGRALVGMGYKDGKFQWIYEVR